MRVQNAMTIHPVVVKTLVTKKQNFQPHGGKRGNVRAMLLSPTKILWVTWAEGDVEILS